jgi:hypothetical protein
MFYNLGQELEIINQLESGIDVIREQELIVVQVRL